jgi:energy-coupling factor transporter ATP-binding protein EcfA2
MTESLITINQKYKSSTRIDGNKDDLLSFIDDFILHGTAVNLLDTVSREFHTSEQKVYTITGPYGSGKSTVALFLSCLLSTDLKLRDYAVAKLQSSPVLKSAFTERFSLQAGWTTVKHVCGLESPANSILLSIYSALNINCEPSQIASLSDDDCLIEIKHILTSQQDGEDGVLILLDEMGKALDYQSRANKDLHLFQALADIVQQANRPVLMIGFLHQAFSDYAKNKDVKTQQDWSKVQGRYRDLSFNPSIDESLILVGDSITGTAKVLEQVQQKYTRLITVVSNAFANQNRNIEALSNTLPLDPIVSLLLGPVSRRRFSQNERSLFGFLASHEKFGFKEFLEDNYQHVQTEFAIYRPEQYWDYLHHNLHHLIVTSHDSKAWLEGCDAIYRAQQKGSDLHVSITKIIALLTIFGFHHQLHAKQDFIKQYFVSRGFKNSEINAALNDLQSWTVIIYRQKHDALFVFQGSDIDINSLITERIEALSQGVDWLSVCDLPQNILATAHYHHTGTMRWATTKLVANIDSSQLAQMRKAPKSGEAFLTFILSVSPEITEQLKLISGNLKYCAIGEYSDFTVLKSAAIELIALNKILKDEQKISHDLIAKNELESRIKFVQQKVELELAHIYKHASWLHLTSALESNAPLSSLASIVADETFDKAPIVINELVNRSKPSGSANSAIRKLMHAMFQSSDKEDLGFDENTFPPEKGLYLSCLKSKGWHGNTPEGFLFPSVWSKTAIQANPKMHALWKDGFAFIKEKSASSHVTMASLYEHWMEPPFGLTAGLCKIYGLALVKSLEGQIAFYDWDSTNQFIFIPELDEELVNKIYKHPHEAGVRYFEISDIQTHLLDNLARATIGKIKTDGAILNIAKHIVGIVHKLPAWVKKTSGESFHENQQNGLTKEARDFRNKVIGANDPYKLILEDLPAVFGFKHDDPSLEDQLGYKLRTAIEDLSAQNGILYNGFKQIVISTLGEEFNDTLKKRCEFVESVAKRPNVKELARRIALSIQDDTKFEFVINLATGAPERNWTDKHLRNGLDELKNLCVQFRRIESFGSLQTKGSSKPLAFITTDSHGNHLEFGGFINHGLENDNDVLLMVEQIKESVSVLSREKQLAALTNLMTNLMEQNSSEVVDD